MPDDVGNPALPALMESTLTHSGGAAAAEPASDPQPRPWLWGLGEGGPATSQAWATGAHAVPHPQASEQQAGLGLRPKLPVALRASGGQSPGDGLHACLRRAPRSLSAAFLEKSTAPLPRGGQNNAPSKMLGMWGSVGGTRDGRGQPVLEHRGGGSVTTGQEKGGRRSESRRLGERRRSEPHHQPEGWGRGPGSPQEEPPADALMQLRLGLLTPRTARESICAVSSCSGSSSWRPPHPGPPAAPLPGLPGLPVLPGPGVCSSRISRWRTVSDSLTERPPEWRPRTCSVPPTARCPGSHGGLQRESRAASSSGPQARFSLGTS